MDGILYNNPTFVQLIGMCPTLATTTSLINGFGMGLSVTAVLVGSNAVISLIKKLVPSKIRIASYVVVISGFVTLIEMLLKAYVPALADALGVFIPLIVVNCLILARAEAFASKNAVLPSVVDGLGMGLGFTIALSVLGAIREILGSGSICGFDFIPSDYNILIFVLPAGAFITLGVLLGVINAVRLKKEKEGGSVNV
ncbi:MAG: electron transport complex subunit E [Clostridia bacterium]|nr:electron transport complex subunit E [Clostridia bacterium]